MVHVGCWFITSYHEALLTVKQPCSSRNPQIIHPRRWNVSRASTPTRSSSHSCSTWTFHGERWRWCSMCSAEKTPKWIIWSSATQLKLSPLPYFSRYVQHFSPHLLGDSICNQIRSPSFEHQILDTRPSRGSSCGEFASRMTDSPTSQLFWLWTSHVFASQTKHTCEHPAFSCSIHLLGLPY